MRSSTATPGGVGDVFERAVAGVAEEPVGQAIGLRDVHVVQPVAVDVADRDAVVAHAAGREDGVEVSRPVVEPGHELTAEGRIPPERGLRSPR